MSISQVKYIKDQKVSRELDQKLRDSLYKCFPRREIFKHQRYYKEMPQHRWYLEDKNKIIAHVAVHEKEILNKQKLIKIGGVAEVFVLPDYRKMGLAKLLLEKAHQWMENNKIPFSMLFGKPKIYRSSGYFVIENEIRYFDYQEKKWHCEKIPDAMAKLITGKKWPDGKIDIQGPTF